MIKLKKTIKKKIWVNLRYPVNHTTMSHVQDDLMEINIKKSIKINSKKKLNIER